MATEAYTVHVTKDYLVFCAAHFINYDKTKCERLHGHNYRLSTEITGPLDDDLLVIDFVALKRLLRRVSDELDHHVILARRNPLLKVEESATEVIVRCGEGTRWVFPKADCVVLELMNTTAEELARWFCERILAELQKGGYQKPFKIRVEIEETPGQSARYERILRDNGGS